MNAPRLRLRYRTSGLRRLVRGLLSLGLVLGLAGAATSRAAADDAPGYFQMSSDGAADPGFAKFGENYYVYTTGGRMAIYRGASLTQPFTKVGTIFDAVPTGFKLLWAPHVFQHGNDYFALFTATAEGHAKHCVYWSVSSSPTGGFSAPQEAFCGDTDEWEAIDPSFVDGPDGSWMVWKHGRYTTGFPIGDFDMRVAKIKFVGDTLTFGEQRTIVSVTNVTCMEAPDIIWHDGRVWLFVSRDRYDTNAYKTEVWSAKNMTSTFTPVKMLMQDGVWGHGPGGAEVLNDHGTTYIAYHVWESDKPTPSTPGKRVTRFAKLTWDTTGPTVSSIY